MQITHQKTFTFPETGESVTMYISDTSEAFKFCIAFNHEGKNLHWSGHYRGIQQLQSQVNPLIWYILLMRYWEGEHGKSIPIERVMMVKDCNAKPHYVEISTTKGIAKHKK